MWQSMQTEQEEWDRRLTGPGGDCEIPEDMIKADRTQCIGTVNGKRCKEWFIGTHPSMCFDCFHKAKDRHQRKHRRRPSRRRRDREWNRVLSRWGTQANFKY